jgi:hypothetical protein
MTGHSHPHPHPHPNAHAVTGAAFRHTADGGPVVLDVGGDIGALVLHTGADSVGHEIEISPIEEPTRRQHVAVHPRDLGGGDVAYAAVYPELVWGTYQLWSPAGDPVLEVSIPGGRVVEATWPL